MIRLITRSLFSQESLYILAAICGGVAASFAAVSKSPVVLGMCLFPVILLGFCFLVNKYTLVFWIIVLTSPFNDYLGLSLGGINVRPYNMLALFGIGCIFLFWGLKREPQLLSRAAKTLPLFIPLILLSISKIATVITLSEMPSGMGKVFSAKYSFFYILLYATCFIVVTFNKDRNSIKKAIKIWIHISNIIVFIAFMQIILSNVAGYHFVHHRDVIFFGRPYSVFREPDVLGSFLGATTVTLIPLLISKNYILPALYMRLSLAVHAVFLLILFVRAAWLGSMFALGLWIICMIATRRARPVFSFINKLALSGIVGALLLLILVPSFSDTLFDRFNSLTKPKGESASEYRMRELTTMFEKSLPQGIGTKEFRVFAFGHGDFSWSYWAPQLLGENYDRSAVDQAKKTGKILVHAGFSMALTTFFDNGAVGIILMLIFFALLFYIFFKALRKADSEYDRSLLYATFLPVACVLICFQFSYDPITPFFWVLVALFVAYRNEVIYVQPLAGDNND